MLEINKAIIKDQFEKCKTVLKLVNWDSNTQEPTSDHEASSTILNQPISISQILSVHDKINSDCPALISGYRGLKFNLSDITKLQYDSNIAQFNNWLMNLKTAFYRDPAKFSTNCYKIILAFMTINKQLKITYNSVVQAQPAISQHWQKFKC